MSRKIIGATVGTTISPVKAFEKVSKFCGVYLLAEGETIENAPKDVGVVIDPNGEADYAIVVDDVLESEEIKSMEQAIADLQYVAIDITAISNNVGTAEMGSTVESVTISWKINKEPVSQTVNGNEVAVGDRSAVVDGPFTSGQSFTVKATDERDATDSASTSIAFYNGVYYGVLEDGVTMDSAAVLSLTKKLKSAKGVTFTDTAGDNQRFSYAHPSRYGTPKFVIGGFEYEWTKTTIDFTNASGYTEEYDIWQHGQLGGGNLTVTVS